LVLDNLSSDECLKQEKDVPVLSKTNRHAFSAYARLHTTRSRDYPGSWQVSFATIPLLVRDEMEASYFIHVWDVLYQAEKQIAEKNYEEKVYREARIRTHEKDLRTF
jgi:hypothetical protein